MSSLIQNFESRPRPVKAILWDGSNKQARQILKEVNEIPSVDVYFSVALSAKQGEIEKNIQFLIQSNTPSGHKNVWPKVNEWIVIWPEGDVEGFSAEAFAETFRVVTHG